MNRDDYKKFMSKSVTGEISDNLNPVFILSHVNSKLLSEIAKGEINLQELAKRELESRGLNLEGKWVGFLGENKFISCFENFNLTKIHYREKAKDAYERGILDDSDMVVLNRIYDLVEQGRLFDARNKIIKLDSLLKPFLPELPENKIKGNILVDFEMKSDLTDTESKEYIKRILEQNLSDEGQIYRHYPDMNSINFNDEM